MSLPTGAADINSVAISGINASAQHTFDLYQIMTGTYTQGEASDMRWGSGIISYQTLDESQTVATTDNGVVDPLLLKEILDTVDNNTSKNALISRFTLNSAQKTSAQSSAGTVTFTNLETGYYLIKDVTVGVSGDDSISSDMLIYVDGTVNAAVKTVKPAFDKAVSRDGTTGNWDEVADFHIGDTVKFQLTATIPHSENLATYTAYKLMLVDSYSAGLTFGQIEAVTCQVGSEDATTISPFAAVEHADGYKLTPTMAEEIQTGFSLELTNLIDNVTAEKWSAGTNDIVVTVVYTATLIAAAPAIGATTLNAAYETHESLSQNSAYMSYSNNPASAEAMGRTASDSVGVFTYKMENTVCQHCNRGL